MARCPRQIADSEFTSEEIREAVKSRRLLALEVELSGACDFRRAYRHAGERPSPEEELSQREVCDVILQGKDLGARKISLFGGEPTSDSDLLEVVRFIRFQGLEVEMFTNGSRLTAELARQLFEERVTVVLKMDTFDESIQDVLTGKYAAFEPIQRAFHSLKDAGYPSGEAFLGVGTVICRQNIDELPTMWRWLRDRDILPYFQIMMPQGNAGENEWLYGESWNPQPPLVGSGCMRHKFSCRVCSQGDVVACVGVNIPIGNIREQKLCDIINDSEVLEDLRDHIETIKGPCRSCEKAEICYGCRGSAYQLTGDYLASDPLCWRNADRKDEIVHFPFPADQIIPQRSPMRVVDAVVSAGERSGEVSVTVSDEMPFVEEDGTIDAVAYFEMMAQSMAALNGFKRLGRSESAAAGYLVGARKLEILGTARVGDRLRIFVYKSSRLGNFATVEATVSRDSTLLARGEIRIWHDAIGSGEVATGSEG
jgi:radical SAM protein with 4Fe4S-binding SPASM domain